MTDTGSGFSPTGGVSAPARATVVLVAGAPWDGVRLTGRSIASHLWKYADVLYVDPPVSRGTVIRYPELADSLKKPRLRPVRPGIYRLTPLVLPGKDRWAMHYVTSMLLRRAIRRAVSVLGNPVQAVVTYSPHHRVFAVCGERVKVFYAADDFAAGAALLGVPVRRVATSEQRIAEDADLIVAVSPALEKKWSRIANHVMLLPNGVEVDAFSRCEDAETPRRVDLSRPIAVVMGHFSERIDLSILEAVADSGLSLLLIGPNRYASSARFGALVERRNVQWVGNTPFAKLCSYLRIADVGLVPYAHSRFNEASFPLKTLEYLAAGLPVVATDLPSIRWLGSDEVAVADAPATFAKVVRDLAAKKWSEVAVAERKRLAEQHSWEKRTELLAQAIGLQIG